jgi:hypothetical protein
MPLPSRLAEAGGFEPPHGGIKIRWLELHERRKAEIDALKVATNALEGCRCPNP